MTTGQPHTPYEPPSPMDMAARQNELPALRLLLAQRRLYSKAKRWASLRIFGISTIAVAAPLITAAASSLAVALGALAGVWIFAARTWFARMEEARSAKAAEIQEQFDLYVFGMPHLAIRDPRVLPEEVSLLTGSDAEAHAGISKESLTDWYPFQAEMSGHDSVALAQRANAAYSERLLSKNANVWLGVTVMWVVLAAALGILLNFTLTTFLLGVAAPLLPALLDVQEQWRATRTAGRDRRALADGIEQAVRRTQGLRVTSEGLLVWQDQMYALRRNSPLVPNLVYKRARDENERAMSAAAADLAAVSRQFNGGS